MEYNKTASDLCDELAKLSIVDRAYLAGWVWAMKHKRLSRGVFFGFVFMAALLFGAIAYNLHVDITAFLLGMGVMGLIVALLMFVTRK